MTLASKVNESTSLSTEAVCNGVSVMLTSTLSVKTTFPNRCGSQSTIGIQFGVEEASIIWRMAAIWPLLARLACLLRSLWESEIFEGSKLRTSTPWTPLNSL